MPERTRTFDLQVRNLTLYPLSYGHTPWGLAEREGFEPSEPCGSPLFESGQFNHSCTSPYSGYFNRSTASIAPYNRLQCPYESLAGIYIGILGHPDYRVRQSDCSVFCIVANTPEPYCSEAMA